MLLLRTAQTWLVEVVTEFGPLGVPYGRPSLSDV